MGYQRTYEILHGCTTRLVDLLKVLEDIVRVAVNNSYSYVVVTLVLSNRRQRRFGVHVASQSLTNRIGVFPEL